MPRQQQHHVRAATSTSSAIRASSAERHQRLISGGTATTTADREPQQQPGQVRLRRVRSFTTRSGTVVNRGDSFKVRAAAAAAAATAETGGVSDVGSEWTRGGPHASCRSLPRSRSAAASTSHGLALEHDPGVVRGEDLTSHDASLYTVLVLGSQGVGKTTVSQQLLTSEYLANRDYNVG